MNSRLEYFKEEIKDKKVAVLGIGVSNIPAIEYLVRLGAKVTARDIKKELGPECDKLKELDIEFVLGDEYLDGLSEYDYILRSPGVKPFEKGIEEAAENGVILTSEIELLMQLCNCKIIGVTGSDGKTTTTTLIAKFLEQAGFKVWIGGNIGVPLFSKLDEIKESDIVVLELSSFQLMTMKISPNIAIITNISPNHLNYHRDYEEYIEAKKNIFLNQKPGDIVILNKDSEFTDKFINEDCILGDIREFSIVNVPEIGVYLKDGNIVSNISGKEEIVVGVDEVLLVGMHNIANICAASTAVIDITGVEPIRDVVITFKGVEHRMEFVDTINGVKWYNDSIGSSPTRTIAGLVAFKQKIILIAGGYDKNIPYDEIGKYIIDKVKVLLLIGKTAPKIEAAVVNEAKKQSINIDEYVKIVNLNTMDECIEYANSIAIEGDIVVLSPASASFDMYKDFEDRGNHFKKLVGELKNK